jgi:microcin C transport system permease protein
MMDAQGGSGRSGDSTALSDEQLEQLKKFYGFDRPWYEAYAAWLGRVVRGDFGLSYRYQEPVAEVIAGKLDVSIYYGLTTLVLTYGICIPLGVVKAMRHRTVLDNATSVLVFAGYAVPGYALGALLLAFVATRVDWLPMGGFTSENFAELSLGGKIVDLARHSFLPLICYLVGSFAFVTMLMKNHLMDNLAADFMRTAIAKGVSYRKAVLRHALRNSLIPVATHFGHSVIYLVTGSFLIEMIFDIDGYGLLGYTSLVDRDYPVVLGILTLSALLILAGNVLSDVLVALVDPRVRFE